MGNFGKCKMDDFQTQYMIKARSIWLERWPSGLSGLDSPSADIRVVQNVKMFKMLCSL